MSSLGSPWILMNNILKVCYTKETFLKNKNNSDAVIGDPFTFVIKIGFLMSTIAQSMEFCIVKCTAAHYHHSFLKILFTEQSQTIRELMHRWPVTWLVHAKPRLPPCPKLEIHPQLHPTPHVPAQAQCIRSVKMLQPQFHHFLRELTCATCCQAWKSERKDRELACGEDLAST